VVTNNLIRVGNVFYIAKENRGVYCASCVRFRGEATGPYKPDPWVLCENCGNMVCTDAHYQELENSERRTNGRVLTMPKQDGGSKDDEVIMVTRVYPQAPDWVHVMLQKMDVTNTILLHIYEEMKKKS